ncbi:hypothetical protein NX059_000876 [Plenodomus lindquistii]|nr:hypothetical protein NX059_000876 [Plenodomus lindquistii]
MTRTDPLSLRPKADINPCPHAGTFLLHNTSAPQPAFSKGSTCIATSAPHPHKPLVKDEPSSIMANNLLPPDLDNMNQGFQMAFQELGRISNRPGVQQGNQVQVTLTNIQNQITVSTQQMTQQIAATNQQITALANTMTQGFQQINNNLQLLTTRLDATVHNQTARAHNMDIRLGTDQLAPFHDPTTNQPIPNFPATGDAIKNYHINQLDALIAAVQMPPVGNVVREAKQVAFKRHIGANFA